MKVFSTDKQVSSYKTYTRRYLFCFKSHRLQFKTTDGLVYDVAIKSLNSPTKKISKRYFKATVGKKTIAINKNSFQKNVRFSKDLLARVQIVKQDFSLEELMCVKRNIAPIVQALRSNHSSESKCQKTAFKIAVFAEKIKPQFTKNKPVVFAKMNDGRPYVAYRDSDDDLQLHFDVSFISYKKTKLIGSGGFKTVHRYYDFQKKKDNIAVSIYNFSKKKDKRRAIREITCHSKLSENSEIISTKATYMKVEADGKNGLGLMVMKRFDGTFDKCLKKYKRSINLRAFRNVAHGIAVMHKMKYVHRDVKFQNVVYRTKNKSLRVKIIDLGLTCRIDDAKTLSHRAGTNYYMPPEVIGYEIKKDPTKIDSWALGIMLYRIYFNQRVPFAKQVKERAKNADITHTEMKDLLVKEANALIAQLLEENEDDPWVQLIVDLIQPDPEKRIKVKAAVEILDDLIENHLPDDKTIE